MRRAKSLVQSDPKEFIKMCFQLIDGPKVEVRGVCITALQRMDATPHMQMYVTLAAKASAAWDSDFAIHLASPLPVRHTFVVC